MSGDRKSYPRQTGQLSLELSLVEIAVNEGNVLDVPLAVPSNKGPHERAYVIEFLYLHWLNDCQHAVLVDRYLSPARELKSEKKVRQRKALR